MQSAGPKRVVSSCIPCYTKKQKCNRCFPCNHCSRRRRPEECVYYPSQAPALSTSTSTSTSVSPSASVSALASLQKEGRKSKDLPADQDAHARAQHRYTRASTSASGDEPSVAMPEWNVTPNPRRNSTLSQGTQRSDSLVEWFGYFEDSESNTMALVRKLGLSEGEMQDGKYHLAIALLPEASEEVQKNLARMPDRQIFDFLVHYFVTDVHWIDQLVHLPWFLAQYQRWWSLGQLPAVSDVEFAVLLLRICSYASQFLPSPSHTIDRIRGMSLIEIRDVCGNIADELAVIAARLHARGSLLRVQHLSFFGLGAQCEGRTNAFWEAIGSAIRVAQRAGIHRCFTGSMLEMHELEKEMRRRVFCNLYIWDSLLSRQIDSIPFLPASFSLEHLPRIHLALDIGADAPEPFLERSLQARLAGFWRSFIPRQGAEYDATVAEERYEKFCTEFLTTLPPIFALEPNKEWDERLVRLPLQRQMLHIAIFDSLCYNFRPVLLREPSQVQSLPAYKKVLLASQKKALAVAALSVLEGVANLHTMLGGSHTRFAGIVFSTFEAALLLGALCMDGDFPGQHEDAYHRGAPGKLDIDPLGSGKSRLTWDRCFQASHQALARLRILAAISKMAEVGAGTLARLLAKVKAPNPQVPSAQLA
ncbi:hypothetical protein BKA61DRAFT_257048 [Leptodontidium sp. MPI-SDFR-AT-0119]|nr:hypothetical protein BKA61DRAFT_257048 [Leptodontidium sp. MPI-SDFR-AT-0119]